MTAETAMVAADGDRPTTPLATSSSSSSSSALLLRQETEELGNSSGAAGGRDTHPGADAASSSSSSSLHRHQPHGTVVGVELLDTGPPPEPPPPPSSRRGEDEDRTNPAEAVFFLVDDIAAAPAPVARRPPHQNSNRWASHCFFFLGSVLYLWLAIWDLRRESTWDDGDDDYDDDDDDDGELDETSPVSFLLGLLDDPYMLLSSAAALCYVGDAAVTFAHLAKQEGSSSSSSSWLPCCCCGCKHGRHQYSHHRHHHHHHEAAAATSTATAANIRLWEWADCATFGLAALLDLLSSLTVDCCAVVVTNASAIGAVNVYLVNAAIVLYGKRRQMQMQQQQHPPHLGQEEIGMLSTASGGSSSTTTARAASERLELIGDLLFGVGCCIDASLSYFYTDRTTDAEWKFVDRGNLVSTVLWLLDSLLYLAAEYCDGDDEDENESDSVATLEHEEEETDEMRIIIRCADAGDDQGSFALADENGSASPLLAGPPAAG